jgi:hypothetical protein
MTQTATVTEVSVSTYTVTQNSTSNGPGASYATLSASVTSCAYATTSETCTLSVVNSGSTAVYPTGCSLIYGGDTYSGNAELASPTTSIQAGSATSVNCSATGRDPGAGTTVTGSLQLSDGGVVPFTGTATN